MGSDKPISENIKNACNILGHAQHYIEFTTTLHEEHEKLGNTLYGLKNQVYIDVANSYYKLAIIELAKLLSNSKSQKFNLWKLTDTETLKHVQDSLVEFEAIIQKVVTVRDKVYSHTDKDHYLIKDENSLSIKELNFCLHLCFIHLEQILATEYGSLLFMVPFDGQRYAEKLIDLFSTPHKSPNTPPE